MAAEPSAAEAAPEPPTEAGAAGISRTEVAVNDELTEIGVNDEPCVEAGGEPSDAAAAADSEATAPAAEAPSEAGDESRAAAGEPASATAPAPSQPEPSVPTTPTGDNWLQHMMLTVLLAPLLGAAAAVISSAMGEAWGATTRTTFGRLFREAFYRNIQLLAPCPSMQLGLELPVDSNYPFQLHSQYDLAWTVTTGGVLRANNCRHYTLGGDREGACSSCALAHEAAELRAILDRAANETIHTTTVKDVFLTHKQLSRRRAYHKARAHKHQLQLLNHAARIKQLLSKESDTKRMIHLLAENRLPRLKALMAQMVKRGHSLKYTIETLNAAIEGRYHPKVYDKEDREESDLVKILGGPRLLHAMHVCRGMMARSTLQLLPHPRLVTSATTVGRAEVGCCSGSAVGTHCASVLVTMSVRVVTGDTQPRVI